MEIIGCSIHGCPKKVRRKDLQKHIKENVVKHILLQNEKILQIVEENDKLKKENERLTNLLNEKAKLVEDLQKEVGGIYVKLPHKVRWRRDDLDYDSKVQISQDGRTATIERGFSREIAVIQCDEEIEHRTRYHYFEINFDGNITVGLAKSGTQAPLGDPSVRGVGYNVFNAQVGCNGSWVETMLPKFTTRGVIGMLVDMHTKQFKLWVNGRSLPFWVPILYPEDITFTVSCKLGYGEATVSLIQNPKWPDMSLCTERRTTCQFVQQTIIDGIQDIMESLSTRVRGSLEQFFGRYL